MEELGYRDLLEGWQADGSYPVTYVPTISRPDDPRNAGWTGRTGRVEAVVRSVCRDLHLRPEKTVVYICGNPDMILNVEGVLMDAASRSSTSRRSSTGRRASRPPSRLRPAYQRGSKMLGGSASPASRRDTCRPPWIEGRKPTPLQARL